MNRINPRHRGIIDTFRLCASTCLSLWLAGCATQSPPTSVDAATAPQWHAPLPAADQAGAPLPHNGTLADLSRWWQQRGDPLLVRLIDAAQTVSPSIASATAHIEQARAVRVATGAALLPALDATASASRSNAQQGMPLNTVLQGGLQASWELDLFGANRAARDAAQARLEGARAQWHDARVSVAAETANRYYSLRACEMLLATMRSDAVSRAETARLLQLSVDAGLQAPATAALARASAAEGSGRVIQQQALCDIDIKALVALTAIPEPDLRRQLAEAAPQLPQAALLTVASVPAQTLAQRPDVFNAERNVAAASADVGNARAQRFPRLSLSGSIGAASVRAGGTTTDLTAWSIGPLALSLPVFDGGRRAADTDAARARYDEAVSQYRASVRQAVREVEEALVNLHSTGARGDDALRAVEGYRVSFDSTEQRYRSGLANLVELEEARRTRLAAEIALVSLQRERVTAWIALYRSAGGGWSTVADDVRP